MAAAALFWHSDAGYTVLWLGVLAAFFAAAMLALLLLYVTLRDPMDPGLPITWPLCFWSASMAFVLLANLATHARLGTALEEPLPWIQACALGFSLWLGLLWLGAGAAWPGYFWSVSLVFHAVMAVRSRRPRFGLSVGSSRAAGVAVYVEGLMLALLVLYILLRFVYVCNMSGPAEVKYAHFVNLFAQPSFLAGGALAVIAARFRVAGLGHAVVVLAILSLAGDAFWPIPLSLGYGFAALYFVTARQNPLAYGATAFVLALVWLLGLLGFTMAGLIREYSIGAAFVPQLVRGAGLAMLGCFALYVLLGFAVRLRATRQRVRSGLPRAPGMRLARAYILVWTVVLAPIGLLAVTAMWPPALLPRPERVELNSVTGLCHAGYTATDEEHAGLRRLGARLVRIPFYWGQLQPEPGRWDFSGIDDFLDAAHRNGTGVVAVLGFDNNAVEQSGDGAQRGAYVAPQDYPLFLEYVRRTVARYRGRVGAWEIWNEPDLPHFYTGTMDEFYELARQTASTIRDTDPDTPIIGTAMSSLFGLYSAPGIEGLHASGALELIDHPAMHTYVSSPRAYYQEFLRVRNAAAKHGHPGAIWITEVGVPDGGVYPWRAARGRAPEHVLKAYAIATAMGIQTVLWHCHRDAEPERMRAFPRDSEHFFGLLTHDFEWKPAAHAYHLVAEHCNGSDVRADLVTASGGLAARQLRSVLYRHGDGRSALVLWYEPGLRPAARARVKVRLGALDAPAMLHDITSDYARPVLDRVLDVGETPLFITYQAPDPNTPVRLTASASPASAAWLLFALLVVAWAAIACLRRSAAPA